AVAVEALEQHGARRWLAVGVHRGQRHGVGIGHAVLLGIVHPAAEPVEGIGEWVFGVCHPHLSRSIGLLTTCCTGPAVSRATTGRNDGTHRIQSTRPRRSETTRHRTDACHDTSRTVCGGRRAASAGVWYG